MAFSATEIDAEVAKFRQLNGFEFLGTIDGMGSYMFMAATPDDWDRRKKDLVSYNGESFSNKWEHVLRLYLLTSPIGIMEYMLLAKNQVEWEARKQTVKVANPTRFKYLWFITIVATGMSVKAIVEMNKPVREQVWPLTK